MQVMHSDLGGRVTDPHDHLVRYVFSRPKAMAIVLRRALPTEALACLDLASLVHIPTVQTNPFLRTRESDLLFSLDAVYEGRRTPVYIAVEHQSTFDARMPWRAVVYAGELWDRYRRDHPHRRHGLPFILPLLLTQHPARNTPTRLSHILELPAPLRGALGNPIEVELHVDDFSGSILEPAETPSPTQALVEIARALLHAYENTDTLTSARIATLAPLFDILLAHKRPDDVHALWVYVISVFESSSPLRDSILNSVSKPAKELYMTIKEELLLEGEARGREIGEARGREIGEARGRELGKAEALLDVLELRELAVPPPVRERVLATRDESQLRRWLARAFTIDSASELFEPLEA